MEHHQRALELAYNIAVSLRAVLSNVFLNSTTIDFDAQHICSVVGNCEKTGKADDGDSQKHFHVTTDRYFQLGHDQRDGRTEQVNVHQLCEELVSSMTGLRKYIFPEYINEIGQTEEETLESLHMLYSREGDLFDEAAVQTPRAEYRGEPEEVLDRAIPVTGIPKLGSRRRRKSFQPWRG